jgi:hypothetical protein
MQSTVRYREFKGMWVGTLPGWDDIEKITVWIGQLNYRIFVVHVHYKDGRRLSFQYDPIQISEYSKENKLTYMVRFDRQGRVLSHEIR